MDKQELGAFLRSRRERLRPEDAGLPSGPRRRTPGLRREEIAVLAHISTEYYVQLEQGRAPRPSGEVLAGIAGALRLTDAESGHLHVLAGTAPIRTGLHRRDVRPSILALLERLPQTAATFSTRDQGPWGEGSTSVASDSTHFRSWDQNLFTEWHSRYGGRGILVYWHVERGSAVVHSQTPHASASEVHAMSAVAIRHGTTMNVDGNYADSHGQSEIGLGITRLLNIDLLPRIKRINNVRLYRPAAGDPGAYPRLTPALTRPIRRDIIADNYDQVIRYATAIREGTASTEAVLSRFTRSATHPAYQATPEIGRAQRTVFAARYLRDRDLQREIEEGLNVVEARNGANAVICYGRGGEISTNRHEEVEMTALCLRILQAALVYVFTLTLQDVLAEEEWAGMLGPADRRGLTPLFWQHVRPYGEVRLDMGARLRIGGTG
jgi:TnpA family transposase